MVGSATVLERFMDLPPNVRDIFEAFRVEPLQPVARLEDITRRHARAAEAAASRDAMVDLDLARSLERACLDLLTRWPALSDPERHLVQAAVRYYVHQDDDEDDFTSIVGFDDDLEVVRFVAHTLGMPDPTPGR